MKKRKKNGGNKLVTLFKKKFVKVKAASKSNFAGILYMMHLYLHSHITTVSAS